MSFTENSYRDAKIKKIAEQTEEDFNNWKEEKRKRREMLRKSLENPETLEEFKTFIYHKGKDAMSPEQLEKYDELATGIIKERKDKEAAQRAKVAAVEIGQADMVIIPTVHTKKNIPLYVVRLSERVERWVFNELNN
jgi:NurA-like 5'-3' nuclease